MTIQGATHLPVPIGSMIANKYRVERIVGKGGMGIVVAARHIKLDELVAIKLMLSDDLGNGVSAERFQREARACAKLRSEHVARVSDVDTLPNGLPYMVMELLEGQDLDSLLKKNGVLPIHDTCSYLIQACRALGDAHKIGIIHRDLKPQNLFLTHREDGSPCIKVLDFGISKNTLNDDSASVDLTRPSDILGSAYYMSPEQALSSKSVVPQSDIYSLGAVLYKLLAGRAPFPRKTLLDVYDALLKEAPPPPSQFRQDLPPALERIILRCLEKNVSSRFSNVNELMVALAPFTVPGETTTADDADSVTTLQHVRAPQQAIGLTGTMPLGQTFDLGMLGQRRASGQTRSGNESATDTGIANKTQPLDMRSLQAALHGYLPPRTIARPPAPSQPQVPPAPRSTPRMGLRRMPLPDDPATRRPFPSIANASSTNGPAAPQTNARTPIRSPMNSSPAQDTVYVSSVANIVAEPAVTARNPLPSKITDAVMTPWNAFPAAGTPHKKHSKLLIWAGGIIAFLIVLLIFKLFS
jgi:serine/threonine-protein kinase